MKHRKEMHTIFMLLTIIFGLTGFSLILPVTASTPTEPHNANAMWFEPSVVELNATEVPVGYKFNVTLWANSSLETKGWQFWLVYAKAYINLTRAGYTAGDKSQFFHNITTLPVSPAFKTHNDTHNRLDFGEAWLMGDKRSPGYGSLCWLEFEIVNLPPENLAVNIPLDIKWAYDLEPPQTYLFYGDGTKKPLNVYNGLIHFVGEEPPPITFTLTITTTPGGTTTPPPGEHTYLQDEEASILATPQSGYTFERWELDGIDEGSVNPILVTMDTNHTLHAVFAAIPPPTGTRIFVDPPEIIDPEMLPSSTFHINITVDDVADLKTCIFNLTYNPEIIGWIGMRLFKIEGQFPSPTMIIDDEQGHLWVNLDYPTSFTTLDPTPLTQIEFHVNALGSTPLDLHDTYLLDSQDQPMDHNVTDGFFMSLIRDVAVTNIQLERDWTYQGWPINITVTVKNKGNVSETFNVQTYYDSNLIGTATVTDLAPNQETNITYVWDTTSVPEGNYTIKATAETVPFEYNIEDNTLVDGIIWIMTQIRDVAIIDMTSNNWAYQGWTIPINVTVENKGNTTETFTVKLYYDDNLIGDTILEEFTSGNSTTITFYWNTSTIPPCHNYTISAEIPAIPYEYNTTNNHHTYGEVQIRLLGDVNGDGYVGIDDIVSASDAFGSYPGHPRWNEYADVNNDSYVGIDDIVIIADNFALEC